MRPANRPPRGGAIVSKGSKAKGPALGFDALGRTKAKDGGTSDILDSLKGLTKSEKKLTPEQAKKLARFEDELVSLRTKVGAESDDLRSDLATKAMLRAMLAATLDMIPVSQEKYFTDRNESAAYAFNALINQAKDISATLRSIDDLEEQGDHIVNRLVGPMLVLFTQNMLTTTTSLKSQLRSLKLPDKQASKIESMLDELVKGQAIYMQKSSEALAQNIKKYLLGE